MLNNEFTKLLKIDYPILQAPMAGGVTTPELAAAVSNAGGLGMIGAGYLSPEQLKVQIQNVKALTEKPFGVNLFVPVPYSVDEQKVQSSKEMLKQIEAELGIDENSSSFSNYEKDTETFQRMVNIVIDEKVPICSFTFGIPSEDIRTKLKKNSSIIIGTATTVQEAIWNEEAGMDAVVVQGSEAGGHRGTFSGEDQQSLIGLMSLIPQSADYISIPIIAAGGIMDGRGLLAAQFLGAQAVQMGTAFLVCEESGANQLHKEAILKAKEDQVVMTKTFSGKMARGVKNRFIEKLHANEDHLPDYPVQNALTKSIRKAAAQSKNPDYMSLWSGQSPRMASQTTAGQLIENIVNESLKLKNTFS
ncbi:nitronate monooxygenase family protein [Neobacillus mesonae]|uniref:NAD(P)H-dependent flavin oxidoreductase n=1 Tax=Neobacillus mesonae TaxID=1193713 RepID=UPI0020408DF1|nr:nitronate monooxygenase [Neobacillus mesonae]MCM3567773.1 nitronate monooxygenase [Neobacillus mesonae]